VSEHEEGTIMAEFSRVRELITRAHIERSAELWEPVYASYDRAGFSAKFEQLDRLLAGSVPDRDRDQTLANVEDMFDVYEGRREVEPALFAYFVSTRIERSQSGYGSEILPFLPLLKYVDAEVRQLAMVGLPPFIADRYEPGPDGRSGAIVFTPVFADMFTDIPGITRAVRRARKAVDDAAEFASTRLDAPIGGLAANLPRLTQLGRTVKAPFPITSGHAGTVFLITRLIDAAVSDGLVAAEREQISVIGAGTIGAAAADLLLDAGIARRVVMTDVNQGALLRTEGFLQDRHGARSVVTVDTAREAISASAVVLSAVTSPLDLDAVDPDRTLDLEGRLLIDDSVPGSLDPNQVECRRGMLSWVVGADETPSHAITRKRFNYGESGLVRRSDLWGCEAELGALTLSGRVDLVVNEPVTPEIARSVGKLFDEVGVEVAPFQWFGRLLSDLLLEDWPQPA
jgi:hypothetical protein